METSDILSKELHAHPPEEVLERYVMHRMSDEETDRVEDHLLICGKCRDAVDESERWVALMKEALPAGPEEPAGTSTRWWQSLAGSVTKEHRWYQSVGAPVLAGALALFLAVWAALPLLRDQARSPVVSEVSLSAVRGNELQQDVVAGKQLQLQFTDIEGAAPGGRVTIVTAAGQEVWTGAILPQNRVLVPGLRPGTYWVRVFTGQGEQIKEYGLLAR